MTRRVVVALTAVTVLAVLLFAVPLAVAVHNRQLDQDRAELTRLAALAASRADGTLPRLPESEQRLGSYDRRGARVRGTGPATIEPALRPVFDDRVVERTLHGELVTVVPVVDRAGVQGAVRASEPVASSTARTRHEWNRLALLALAASLGAALVGLALARRLVRPLDDLVVDATRIGDGDFTVRARRSGLSEIDAVGAALTDTAGRLSDVIAREQAFSADASHQLRSPLAGLRVTIEGELAHPRPDPTLALEAALVDVDRLEQTIDDFLALAREGSPTRPPVDLRPVLDDLSRRWVGPLAAERRRLLVGRAAPDLPTVRASSAAVSHVLDVLVGNALVHGAGDVVVEARAHHGALSLTVTDSGAGVADPDALFQRRQPGAHGNGIGLALARRLAEAEGGRLTLRTNGPPDTTFELTIPTT